MALDTQGPRTGTSGSDPAGAKPGRPRGRFSCLVSCGVGIVLVSALMGSSLQAEEKDVFYQLGNLSVYADHCGYHKDSQWLRTTFGEYVEFMKGRKETKQSLAFADRVRMPCGKVKEAVRGVEKAVAQD